MKHGIRVALAGVLLALLVQAAPAQLAETYEGFADPVVDARYRDLIHTIRCMKCQNQSIAESPIDQAADIRRQVRELIQEGKTDNEIRVFLAERYGDFINYRPPFKPTTWLLWSAPVLLLLSGGIVFARILRDRMNQPLDEDLD